MFKLNTFWASDVWQWSASCFKCQWSLTMSWASPSECATLRRMASVRMPRHMPRRLRRVLASQQWRVAIVLPYLPAGHEFTETPKIFWSLGKGRVGLKKDRISCSFLMFFNVFTAFQRCWVNSKTAPHVTSSGRNYVGRLNACEGICVGNSFPLPILSPNPMVHPVVQHDFHCCQFKDFKAVYGYALLSCLANAVGGCWRLVAVGRGGTLCSQNIHCDVFQRELSLQHVATIFTQDLTVTPVQVETSSRAERPQLDFEIGFGIWTITYHDIWCMNELWWILIFDNI